MDHRGTQRLETERLILRRFTVDDAHMTFANWCSDPEVARYTTWPAHSDEGVTRALLEDWTSRYGQPDYYNWVLELKTTGEVIGNCSVVRIDESIDEAELGWCMSRREWGKGYMPEAARAVMRFLFDEVGANRVCAKHDVDNPKSGRVMQKIGMQFEGVRRQGFRGRNGIVNVACYAIVRSDLEGKKELWDACDRDGKPLGIDLVRGEPVPKGMYHRVCDVVVRHADGRFLLMRRDPRKNYQPGRWEMTAGGSALKGEDALACIRRELYEETGLRCDDFIEVFTQPRDDSGSIFTLFFAKTDCDPASVRLQEGETVDYRWVDRAELEGMLDSADMVTHVRSGYYACVEKGLIE